MTWEQVKALSCAEFVTWLDEHHREGVRRMMQQRWRKLSDVDFYEAWGMVALYAWQNGRVADDFNGPDHVRGWCIRRHRNMLRFMWTNEEQRRGFRGQMQRASEVLISELASEQYRRDVGFMDKRSAPPTMAPSGEGWLTVLLDELTPVQRRAIELLVIADRSPSQAVDIEPERSRDNWTDAKRSGLKACRRVMAAKVGPWPRMAQAA